MVMFVSTAYPLVLSAVGLHRLVLFFFLFENFGNSQAAFLRQVADVTDDLPHLVVFENAFPGRHSRRIDAINDNLMQLAVGIILNVL